jgi:mannose-6-phosphate isomerase-like protein (cupin superfamily)
VKTDDLRTITVMSDLPHYEQIEGHHQPAAIYLSNEDHPGVPVRIAAVDASRLVGQPLADLHRHACDEIYLVVSPGLKFAVETMDGTIEITSPASVRIPAGLLHRFLVRDVTVAPCVFLGILLEQQSDDNS